MINGDWIDISLVVNGVERSLVVASDRRLLSVLRDDLGLTGTKTACEVSVCGACTVLVDGRPTSSCVMLAARADGREVITVEGVSRPRRPPASGGLHPGGGFQCGFCTSGQIVAATSLLLNEDVASMARADIQVFMLGNLCR